MSKTIKTIGLRLFRKIIALPKGGDDYVDFSCEVLGTELIERKIDDIEFIFMHIHKCGGTSFIEAIEGSPNAICCASIPGDYSGRTGRDLIPDQLWDKSFKFTCVRNPYARVASAYSMFVRSPRWQPIFPSFDDFVKFLSYVRLDEHHVFGQVVIGEYKRTIDNVIHHCTPFCNPKYLIDEMDEIIKLENLGDELRSLIDEHGLQLDTLTRRKQTGGGDGYRDLYSDESRRVVSDIYAADLERFGYAF